MKKKKIKKKKKKKLKNSAATEHGQPILRTEAMQALLENTSSVDAIKAEMTLTAYESDSVCPAKKRSER